MPWMVGDSLVNNQKTSSILLLRPLAVPSPKNVSVTQCRKEEQSEVGA